MCGINGIFGYGVAAPPLDPEELAATRDAMTPRGPDGSGLWLSDCRRIGFGHRRLSIVDLSDAGAQPMRTADGSLVVTFNGEIYNHLELRRELEGEGVHFRSRSDTEVLLHLYRRDGSAMVDRLRGMFAFAIWDAHAGTLFLARDPHGIKPLYYADDGHTFRFASQVAALRGSGKTDESPDPSGAVGLLLWGSVPEPFTLYRGIRQLPAGSTLSVHRTGMATPRRYWNIADAMRRSRHIADRVPRGEEREFLRAALLDSVRTHLLADVPVGAFLSAGLDSSTLVGLAREAAQAPIQTLTLTFDSLRGTRNDESPLAADIARHLDVKHECVVLPAGDMDSEIDRFLAAMDQPTIDGFNTWLISRAAAGAGLKVALSGLGGDELLGGYGSFSHVPDLRTRAARTPWRHVAETYLFIHAHLGKWLNLAPNAAGIPRYAHSPEGAYHLTKGVFMPWELKLILDREAITQGLDGLVAEDAAGCQTLDGLNDFEQVAYLESARYMRNQLLRDSDWTSMAHSLEIRVPLVDARLTEAVIGLAATGRLGKAKEMLPLSLREPLPESIVNRPKTGFLVPTWRWLRHHPELAGWKQVPVLKHSRFNDYRRWAYVLLRRSSQMDALFAAN